MAEKEKVIWKNYPGIYFLQANQLGEARIVDHYVTRSDGQKQFVKGHVLKQYYDRYGYLYVTFRINGKLVHLKVHRIVIACFRKNPNNLLEINHIDCDPTNNRLENLEFCTTEYNIAYREKYGKSAAEAVGKPVIAINLKTGATLWFGTQYEAGRELNIPSPNVNMVVKGKQKTSHGFWFCNADENAVEKTRVKFGDEVASEVEKLINEKLR